jgi:hypothetical protein
LPKANKPRTEPDSGTIRVHPKNPAPTPPSTPTLGASRTSLVADTLEEVSHSIENLVIPPPIGYSETDETEDKPPALPTTPKPPLELIRSSNSQSLEFLLSEAVTKPIPTPRPQSMLLTNKHVRFSDTDYRQHDPWIKVKVLCVVLCLVDQLFSEQMKSYFFVAVEMPSWWRSAQRIIAELVNRVLMIIQSVI